MNMTTDSHPDARLQALVDRWNLEKKAYQDKAAGK